VGDKAGDTLTAFPSKAHEHRAGEMGDRIRQFDWSTTPLGPMSHWPQSLRTVINILLSSRYAMWMAWGPELSMLYNDAYQPTLGLKHPRALGMRASEVWAEIWPDIGPRIETVLTTGEATYDEGLLLFLERSGAGLRFEIDCKPLPEPVYVDREMWEKIVLNLLSNALKFTFEGSVSIVLKAAERHAQLTIKDTGSGIPASELPHVSTGFIGSPERRAAPLRALESA
jgi:hypothetical protein